MNEIKINVVSKTGAGKTTIVRLIAEILTDIGFEIEVNTIDDLTIDSYQFKNKLASLKQKGTKIIINEVQELKI